jgi:hypothetical protein
VVPAPRQSIAAPAARGGNDQAQTGRPDVPRSAFLPDDSDTLDYSLLGAVT